MKVWRWKFTDPDNGRVSYGLTDIEKRADKYKYRGPNPECFTWQVAYAHYGDEMLAGTRDELDWYDAEDWD